MIKIRTKSELRSLADRLAVRRDWHEPDEQDVTATVHGTHLDNAGFWGNPSGYDAELYVVLERGGEQWAVNLATLLAWATGLED